jgi:hypothetical protein
MKEKSCFFWFKGGSVFIMKKDTDNIISKS